MKLILLIGIVLIGTACKTAATPAPSTGSPKTTETVVNGPFEVAEAAGRVERMHSVDADYFALVTLPDGTFVLLRLAQNAGAWVIVDRMPATEDYLWPEQ